MTEALRALGIVILGAFLSFILKEAGFRGARLVSVLVIILASLAMINGIKSILTGIYALPLGDEIVSGIGYVLRIVGASYVFGISADVCREIGESGIAGALLAIGRIEIILLSLPAITEIFTLAGELL